MILVDGNLVHTKVLDGKCCDLSAQVLGCTEQGYCHRSRGDTQTGMSHTNLLELVFRDEPSMLNVSYSYSCLSLVFMSDRGDQAKTWIPLNKLLMPLAI